MTNAKRLEALKRLKEEMRQPLFRTSIQKRRDCLSQIVPLLNFADVYYENAMPIADILGRPGFSSNMYEQSFARMDYLIGQAITELEDDLTPRKLVEFQAEDEKAASPLEKAVTSELVQKVKQQAESFQKPDQAIWNELMARFSWIGCPKEDLALIGSLDSLLRPLNGGYTMLPPRMRHIPGSKMPQAPVYYQRQGKQSSPVINVTNSTANKIHQIFVASSLEAKAQAKVLMSDLARPNICFRPWWDLIRPGEECSFWN